jgi:hypothetical protein
MRCDKRLVRTKWNWALAAWAAVIAFGVQGHAFAFSFDDIKYWVGSGNNRAAFAIDWQDGSTQPASLVWGYRWNGTATGAQMLSAIVADDRRLFAKVGGTVPNPAAVYGFGYDANNNGQFGIDDGTVFDSQGFVITDPADLATATDAGDYYAEGWFTGFWHYGVASSNPYGSGQWSDSQVGMSSRQLTDGAWDSWAFTTTYNFAAFAQNPVAVPSPYVPGDFDHDGHVTASDYNVWRASFGSTTQLNADGNGNQIVDAADYVVWRQELSVASGQSAISSHLATVPEPIFTAIGIQMVVTGWGFLRRRRLPGE